MRTDDSTEGPTVILNSRTVMKVAEASGFACLLCVAEGAPDIILHRWWLESICVLFKILQWQKEKWYVNVASFPGKGSDDAVEQTDGRMQTGCCLLGLPVNLWKSHFPMHFCESRARAQAVLLESNQRQWHTEPHLNLRSLHFIFCF